MAFKKYNLSSTALKRIARLCVQEQGSLMGVRAEASQGANLLETNSKYKRFGSDIEAFFEKSGWYYEAKHYMDYGSASEAAIEAVQDVLCNGNRLFPQYVDEHDCIRDIKYVILDGKYLDKNDKSSYKKDRTIIKNNMGSTYTFYSFPAPGSDPFGYTADAYKYVTGKGTPDMPVEEDDGVSVTANLPELYLNCPSGSAVQVWRIIIGMKPTIKTFNETVLENTKKFQEKHGLKADGIVGKKTWAVGLGLLK